MKIECHGRRWGVLASAMLAVVLGMPGRVRAEGPVLAGAGSAQEAGEAQPAQIASVEDPSGPSGDDGGMEENRRRRWCSYYYYPAYVYYYQPVWYYCPVVTYPVSYPTVTYPTVTYLTVTMPTYGPPAVPFNAASGSADGNDPAADQVANELKRASES